MHASVMQREVVDRGILPAELLQRRHMQLVWSNSSVLAALAGGALIGAAASLLLRINGRVAGISGILSGLLSPDREELGWRVLFVAGRRVGGAPPPRLHPPPLPL